MTPETSASSSDRMDVTTVQGAVAGCEDTVQLESCHELEWITVTTCRSTYDVIVISGNTGAVMVRGGHYFPEFRRASITGSLFHGILAKAGSISVGLNLEFVVDGQSVVTSRIQAISRHHWSFAEGHA